MRTRGLTGRDLAATLIVAVVATLFGLWSAGVDVPGLESPRMMTLAVIVLGGFACGAGSAPDAFEQDGLARHVVSAISLLGAAVLVVAVAALASGSTILLDVEFVGVFALWATATGRHLAMPSRPPARPRIEDQRVLVSTRR